MRGFGPSRALQDPGTVYLIPAFVRGKIQQDPGTVYLIPAFAREKEDKLPNMPTSSDAKLRHSLSAQQGFRGGHVLARPARVRKRVGVNNNHGRP